MHRRIKSPNKYLKWSKKELPIKTVIACHSFERRCNMSNRNLNTVQLFNMSRFQICQG